MMHQHSRYAVAESTHTSVSSGSRGDGSGDASDVVSEIRVCPGIDKAELEAHHTALAAAAGGGGGVKQQPQPQSGGIFPTTAAAADTHATKERIVKKPTND
jgi:hypothetical protein